MFIIAIELVFRKFNNYKSEHAKAVEDIDKFVSLPTNAFLLTKRLSVEYDNLLKEVEDSTKANQVFISKSNSIRSDFVFPKEDDFAGVINALIRLQDTYNLTVNDIANGVLNGVQYDTKLTAADCFDIGRQAFTLRDFYHAEPWIKEALERIDSQNDLTISRIRPLEINTYLTHARGDVDTALQMCEEIVSIEPSNQNIKNFKQKILNERVQFKNVSKVTSAVAFQPVLYSLFCSLAVVA